MTTGNSGNEWGNQGVPKYGDDIYAEGYTPDPAPTVDFSKPSEPVREQAPDTSWMTYENPEMPGRRTPRDPSVERGMTQLKLMLIGIGKVALFGVGVVVVFCIVAFILGMISAVL